ncbi:hypothetical protein FQ154_01700 [Paeniglutamicibacter gangotriensis]|uniref:Uncharacterized protein n=1 Tax=Paeniglutamicibacter gangotriensis TaxID=254787 RepID=A0A5B0ERM7_9MICC|nr:hypothetical protein [Paeniglutamicibacter gangotriensis]KAA0979899.1 hypothetical protein FQ154_01700 [Paeniglutamicibacter gangotriensis]
MTTTPEQCHLCGHSHPVMAHWMGNGETRALCHEDDHSCYTRHNRSDALRLHNIDFAKAEGDKAYEDFLIRSPSGGTYKVSALLAALNKPRPVYASIEPRRYARGGYFSDKEGIVSIDILPDVSEFVRALKRLGKAATRTQRAIKRLKTTTHRRKPLIHNGKKP